jgi:hypothetical protein
LQATHVPRPGLAEVVLVWALFGIVAVEVLVTYARLPPADLYNTDESSLAGGAGRALVFLNYPTALVAIAVLMVVSERLRGRGPAILAGIAALLCLVVLWPGVVEQSDLDAKPVNALPAIGVLLAVALTVAALARGGIGRLRSFEGWDVVRVALAVVIVAASVPWIAAEAGYDLEGVPGLGALFLTGEPRPEPQHPGLTAVHLGHHHGMDGALLALAGLALSRVVRDVRPGIRRGVLGLYVALMFVYGLANAVQDFWLEQLVKRGTTSLEIPSLIVPKASPAWAALVAAALIIHFAARRVRTLSVPAKEGVP